MNLAGLSGLNMSIRFQQRREFGALLDGCIDISAPVPCNRSICQSEDSCTVMFLKKHALCAPHDCAGKQSGVNWLPQAQSIGTGVRGAERSRGS